MPPRIKGTQPVPTYLQAWREHVGLTQDAVLHALAKRGISLSKPSLSRLENQRQPYSEPILLGLASVYGCSPADLISVAPASLKDEDAEKLGSARILPNRQPRRPHFIREWAEARGFKQVDLADEVGADKSVVSRWFNGTTPGVEWQLKLAALFGCEPESLFSHPDEEWFKRFLAKRQKDEIERIKTMLQAAFPDPD